MKKKGLAILLSITTVMAVHTGCGTSGQGGENAAESKASEAAASGTETGESTAAPAEGELVNVIWQWPAMGATGSGFQAVEDALNAMLEKDIGVHVTLEPALFSDLQNQSTLTITSGEQLDIILQVGTGVTPYVANGLIQPVDEYVEEYGAAIKEKCGTQLLGGYYQGKLYGIPTAYIDGESYGYMARKDILEKYNIEIDPDKLYTLDEVEKIFETVKAGEGDKFFMNIPETTSANMLHNAYCEVDTLGNTPAAGVLMLNRSFTDLTLYNLFETEEYEAYAQKMYEYAQKGYVSSDAATNTEDANVLLSGGNFFGYFTWTTPNCRTGMEATTGYELVEINMIPQYGVGGMAGVSWMVPITSGNPGKAVQALNYIYENKDACKLLQFGIEGQDYEVLETSGEDELIKRLADDPTTLPYYMPYGIYGARLEWPVVSPAPIDENKMMREWNASMPAERKSAAVGYSFDTTEVSTEYSAVNAVISQYQATINCGALDPVEVLPEFQAALKGAGIDKLIAENQKQMDAWAVSK